MRRWRANRPIVVKNCNTLFVCEDWEKVFYPRKGKFTARQLSKAVMVKSAFSAGKRIEHMWSRVIEVQVEDRLVKGVLDNEPLEIMHLELGATVTIPFNEIEDVWYEGEMPESVKILLKLKADESRTPSLAWGFCHPVEHKQKRVDRSMRDRGAKSCRRI